MRNRLFDIVDGEPIITAPLVNLSAFKRLWDTDNTPDKSVYKKWMLYLYYMYDYKSEFYEVADKEPKILQEVFNRKDIKIPTKLKACIKEYISKNTSAEQRTLTAAIQSADNVSDNLGKIQQNAKQLDEIISALEKKIDEFMKSDEILAAVELTKEKLDIQSTQLELIKKSTDLIPKIEKGVESIISLRDKVEKSIFKIEESKDNLENYIIDSFLDKKNAGYYDKK
jgi:hypothetical protein